MVKKWKITIPELTGDTPRNAYVYLPAGYDRHPETRYPVLYMFDGHNVFFDSDATYGKSWGMSAYLNRRRVPIIVAAVECDHSPNHGRLSEYSPYSFRDSHFGSIVGRGEITMQWLTGVFKPYIDKTYRTKPDREHTFIAGSSMGGLMSLYAVTAWNGVFSRAACLSPSIWVGPERLEKLIRTAKLEPGTVVYMDYGDREMPNHSAMARRLSRIADRLLARRVMLNFRIVPGGEHCEASWEQQIPFFMDTLMYELDQGGDSHGNQI